MILRAVPEALRDRRSLHEQRVLVRGRLLSTLDDTWLEGDGEGDGEGEKQGGDQDGDGTASAGLGSGSGYLILDVPGLARQLLPHVDPYVGGPRVYDDPAEVDGTLVDLGEDGVRLRAIRSVVVRRGDVAHRVQLAPDDT